MAANTYVVPWRHKKMVLLRQSITCCEIAKRRYNFGMTYMGNHTIYMTVVMLFLVGNKNDSTTCLLPNISFLSWEKLLHSTKMWRTVRIHWQCSHRGGGSEDIWMGQMCMTNSGMTQDNFILPSPPVGGLPLSQDWLDRMKLVCNHTIPTILPSGKNILVDTMFKIILGYTNLGMRQIQCRLGSRVCPFITINANMAGYPQTTMSFLAKFKKTHFCITIPKTVS